MQQVKVTQVGNSVGVVLPKDVAARLKVGKGDVLTIVETPDGIELTPYNPAFEEEVAAAATVMKRYRNALRELAK